LHFITISLIAVNEMTMIYNPIPFVKLVKKILVGNYEPMGYLRENIYN